MPRYRYRAIAADGTAVAGVQTADTADGLRVALLERDLHPVDVEEKVSFLRYEITKDKVPRRDLMHFSRQLAVFVRAGIPVLDALDLLAGDAAHRVLRRVLAAITADLRAGLSLADAAALHPEAFPAFYVAVLRAAELTGRLDSGLDQLAHYVERDLDARRKVTSALYYPAVILAMSLVSAGVLAGFVLPRFVTFFESFDASLPLPTRIMLSVSDFLSSWWFLILAGLGVAAVVFLLLLRTDKGGAARDRVLLRLPIIGDLVRHALVERFCRVFASLVDAGVPLVEALEVTAEATGNVVFRRGLSEVRAAVLRGEGLAAPLCATELFPTAAQQMIRVGEATGTLDDQLQRAAAYYDGELDHKIKRFTTLFEPAVILLMGGIVGFVAISLVSAMYGIFQQVEP